MEMPKPKKTYNWSPLLKAVKYTVFIGFIAGGLSIVGSAINYCIKARATTCAERWNAIKQNPMSKSEAEWWRDNYDQNSDCALNGTILSRRNNDAEIDNKLKTLTGH